MNRFSNDLSIMDNILVMTIIDVLELSFYYLSLVLTVIILAPLFIIVTIFLFGSYLLILRIYSNPIRDIKRLDLVNKGPLFAFFSATISGASTIRAYR